MDEFCNKTGWEVRAFESAVDTEQIFGWLEERGLALRTGKDYRSIIVGFGSGK